VIRATKNFKQLSDRVDAAKKAYRDGGAELKQVFLVMGQYDLVAVLEAPNDETLAKIALAQSMLGVFRSTETDERAKRHNVLAERLAKAIQVNGNGMHSFPAAVAQDPVSRGKDSISEVMPRRAAPR
jgi:uncharacterized protein with GYD domain